ncbi:hypothetical protein BO70DRAFT_361066 [Aspergillus heteromorphus CBS 117.55]|uniref:Uncharacterized protein n=1 Tax=Aspergillus heteromorphus CBS 117.55 TaxID=1448321 RepID=A0A317WMF9_9EURO|nr:uncharacterized protein BO70DRAFT_361066 [Aspergillus heteromorphus CBS 117.55]PWY86237.1 hypothetical protein BO70DRAFT_361066 [Aspergillus heteromorphus CBS 117.55]
MFRRLVTVAPRAGSVLASPRIVAPAVSGLQSQTQSILRSSAPQRRGYHEKDMSPDPLLLFFYQRGKY